MAIKHTAGMAGVWEVDEYNECGRQKVSYLPQAASWDKVLPLPETSISKKKKTVLE